MFLLLLCLASAQAVQFQLKNNLGATIWVAIQGNHGYPALENGGFVMNNGAQKTINSADNWQGRFWARTGCNANTNHCETGDCAHLLHCDNKGGEPPFTIVEIFLKGQANGDDFYDVSLVDGFNVRASITPKNGKGQCQPSYCNNDVNSGCLNNDLKVIANGRTVGCKSACNEYKTDQYCCNGKYHSRATCITNDWKVNTAKYFKDKCPHAYSYAFDDPSSLYTCQAKMYEITFG